MNRKSKVSVIQMPDTIIRDSNIGNNEFALLCFFKFLSYKFNSLNFNVDIKDVRDYLSFKDNRTIKKSLSVIWGLGFLKSNPQIGRKKIEGIQLIDLDKIQENKFTQLPSSLITNKWIPKITVHGYRLLYYFESYITRKEFKKRYAHPSLDVIVKTLNMSKNSIIKYIKILEQENLLNVERNYEYLIQQNEQGETTIRRVNNNYYINLTLLL